MSDTPTFDPIHIVAPDSPAPKRRGRKPPDPTAIAKRRPHVGNPKELDGSLASVCSLLGNRSQGIATLINLVRACGRTNPDAATFATLYDNKSAYLRKLTTPAMLEDLCTEAGIPWPRLVGWAFEAAASTGQHLAAMKAALALPSVVDKTIKFAKQKDGYRDRDFLYRSTGFLPSPSGGISIINNLAANAQARNIAVDGEMFTPFERDIVEITGVMTDGKTMLPAAPAADIPTEAEEESE